MVFDLIVGRNESDKKAFGRRGLVYLGKNFVTMGSYTSLSNSIYMDVARSHVVLVSGKRGSGKSYTLGVLAEALSDLGAEEAGNVGSLIFDTMGIYWTMKYQNVKDEGLLDEWGLKAKNTRVKVFAPMGYYDEFLEKGVDVDSAFAIKISELGANDWVNLFELKFTDQIAVLIEKVINDLVSEKDGFGFDDIFEKIEGAKKFSGEVRNSVVSLFEAARGWGVFSEEEGTSIKELVEAGVSTVIDLSMYASVGGFNVRGLVIGLVSKKIFDERMRARKTEEISAVQHGADYERFRIRREMPLVWIFIDEAHEFLPHEDVGKTPATDALVQLLREGRQPGVSMVLATQQPGKIHTDVMTQSDIVISHRVTARNDTDALNDVTQSYMKSDIVAKLNGLPHLKGSAVILDDNSERIYPMRIRPRFTWHGGEAPMAIRKEEGV
jgi:DNA helicase HerA-like ATPase